MTSVPLPSMKPSSAPSAESQNWLVVDFDGTCSIDDTTPMLPHLAGLLHQERTDSNYSNGLQERLKIFSELEKEYFKLYKEAQAKIDEDQTLLQALNRLDDVSNRVTQKVSSSGVLEGLLASLEFTKEMGQLLERHSLQVRIRPYCGSVLSRVHSSKRWELGVLSINWCPSLIAASLQTQIAAADLDTPIIWSNLVHADTGEVSLLVPGALAKKERITKLRQRQQEDAMVVYLGDSSTDLAAMIEADIGILMGGSESTINMAKRWGVVVRPLSELLQTRSDGGSSTKREQNTIWTTDCWSEVEKMLESTDEATWFQ